jgi:hypothetical protein
VDKPALRTSLPGRTADRRVLELGCTVRAKGELTWPFVFVHACSVPGSAACGNVLAKGPVGAAQWVGCREQEEGP